MFSSAFLKWIELDDRHLVEALHQEFEWHHSDYIAGSNEVPPDHLHTPASVIEWAHPTVLNIRGIAITLWNAVIRIVMPFLRTRAVATTIVLLGYSLGDAICAYLAEKYQDEVSANIYPC